MELNALVDLLFATFRKKLGLKWLTPCYLN